MKTLSIISLLCWVIAGFFFATGCFMCITAGPNSNSLSNFPVAGAFLFVGLMLFLVSEQPQSK